MKYIICILAVLCLAGSVSATGILNTISDGITTVIGGVTYAVVYGFTGVYTVLKPLVETLAVFMLIIVLQYAGVDVIGITFSIITYTIETFFNILSQVSIRQESLISAVILFIIAMAIYLNVISPL